MLVNLPGSEEMITFQPPISYLQTKRTRFHISSISVQLGKVIIVYRINCYTIIKQENKKGRKNKLRSDYSKYQQFKLDEGDFDDINDTMSRYKDKIKEIENKYV